MQKRRGVVNQISNQEERELFAELFAWAKQDDCAEVDAEEFVPSGYGADLDIFGEGLTRIRSLLRHNSTTKNCYTLSSTSAVSFETLESSAKTILKRGVPIKYFVSAKVLLAY